MSNQSSMSALTISLTEDISLNECSYIRYVQSVFNECSYISLTEDMSNQSSMSALTLV